ncbi:MAG: hypothetical protein IKF95_01100 [Firmicutes bacterium]|nr:hypothetical protein [Bacillota bacterium]MBR3374287.1 hypothetical protein [Bacillota bacterium]
MNKIKDIIYNKSDILIALLILAIAALIIFWRLSIILEYPKELIGTDEASEVLTEPDEDAAAANANANANTDAANAGTDANQDAANSGTDANANSNAANADANKDAESESGDSGEVTKSAKWDGDKLAADLQVTLTGTTAYEAVSCLVDAGVFADYDEYDTICGEMGYDDEKMKAGVFDFPKGSTKQDIIKAVNWS